MRTAALVAGCDPFWPECGPTLAQRWRWTRNGTARATSKTKTIARTFFMPLRRYYSVTNYENRDANVVSVHRVPSPPEMGNLRCSKQTESAIYCLVNNLD